MTAPISIPIATSNGIPLPTLTLVPDPTVAAMYPAERAFTTDDGSGGTFRCVVAFRQAPHPDPRILHLKIDSWEVDAAGVPTGINAQRFHSARWTSGEAKLADIVAFEQSNATQDLLDRKAMLAALAQPSTFGIQMLSTPEPMVPDDPDEATKVHPSATPNPTTVTKP